MDCSDSRTAVSARIDGEAPPPEIPDGVLDAHLRECAACREWARRAERLRELTTRLSEW
ncbi:zf-HC2 domain-containing protein [Streptomyces palmae]|uniref:Zf-HC2 domain-containing protein n=1 Tax=Streptomyces palmae TaxID=1701085 RepID=A0A4Z0H561_9ACTN|nr:zf-HC2 domain-containing protein [Streptomyces palmae]TGB05699.1 zf-HC2 domain-containing protein [Streptomyces palmae]